MDNKKFSLIIGVGIVSLTTVIVMGVTVSQLVKEILK